MSRTIVVTGATGAQGGGLARAILNDPEKTFSVRAITRKPDSEPARRLADLGADIVKADLNDLNSLKDAFSGAHGAFCVTNYWELLDPELEQQQARNHAAAAAHADLDHVIWSTLEDTRNWIPLDDDRMPTLMEKYKVPHYDSKGSANRFFADLNVAVTFLNTSFYWDNFIYFGLGPQRAQDGSLNLVFNMGDRRLPGIAAGDIGKCALGIFKAGEEYVGKTIYIAGELLTGYELAKKMSHAVGQKIGFFPIDADSFRNFDFVGADDIGNMFQFKHDFEKDYCGPRDPSIARRLNPELKSFDEWLAENADRIPIPEAVSSEEN